MIYLNYKIRFSPNPSIFPPNTPKSSGFLMKNEFEGEIAGLQADMLKIPQQLVNFLIEEVGKDPHNAINFIDKIVDQLKE
jgi:hypothetical protein